MKYILLFFAGLLLSSVALSYALSAPAYGVPDSKWFEGLVQPDNHISCCDVSDCKKTRADWHDDQWFAEVGGQMTPIPQNKILRNKQSPDGEAYVCAGAATKAIYCFVPPSMGY